ncbi:TfuA domain-containing protein core [Candidatus Magnetoovum chiemensis]|nr:TfuA domain-containing protein core [Candidatus Magnetoovum chiemensis]
MDKPVIFLGPTLSLCRAREILDAVYLGPVEQAGLISAVTTYRPRVIGIIDGVFGQSLSLWHKEILYALEQGVHVYGASSMGAIRAAETCDFGAVGVGEVFRMYRSGEINDDDEVALMHSLEDGGYRSLSHPMVNIRKTFLFAVQRQVISLEVCSKLIAIAKSLYYPNRVFANIFDIARKEGIDEDTIEKARLFCSTDYVDIKMRDAVELLETIRDLPKDNGPFKIDFDFSKSTLFSALYNRDRTVSCDGVSVAQDSIACYTALHKEDFGQFNFNALNRALVVIMADMLKVDVSIEDVDREKERFLFKHKVNDVKQWLADNHLSDDEFNALMRENALCRRLHKWLLTRKYLEKNVKIILDALRLDNTYEQWAKQASNQEQVLQKHFPDFNELTHKQLNLIELLKDHFRHTKCRMDVSVSEWADEAGFHGFRNFQVELLKSKLVRDYINEMTDRLINNDEWLT